MSWTNRLARHGSERSLHSLSTMHSGTRAPTTSPTSVASPRTFTGTPLEVGSPSANENNASSSVGTSMGPTSSAGDSRIPRPSPTSLRRSASMRVRGERVVIPNLRHSSGSSILHQHHQQQRHAHLIKQHQQLSNNHQQIAEEFSAITENGIDSHRHRSFSLSLTPARPRSGHAASGNNYTGSMQQVDDSDVESVKSYGSACSTASACDHAHFALNGTTWSGRSRKYVVHCSNHNGEGEQYLTPTQRAARQIRKFQNLLSEAQKQIEEKDREILRLTKEVVELRLYKASLNSPDERTDSSDALTVREANPFSPDSPIKDLPEESGFGSSNVQSPATPEKRGASELPGSLADSGHFDDDSVHSKDSVGLPGNERSSLDGVKQVTSTSTKTGIDNETPKKTKKRSSSSIAETEETNEERRRLIDLYERKITEMQSRHIDEIHELKEKHNDKVESLLNQLSELNTRYCEIRPSMDAAEARVRDLGTELESAKNQLAEQKAIFEEQEERNKQMYLKMYTKGQEAARIEQADKIYEQANQTPPKVTIAEVLQQLNVTQAELENVKAMYRRIVESRNRQGALDPEITLQFLKSAIYYFLTDKENHHGHLSAIESILGFTDNEKLNIDKIYGSIRK
ncbi:uncharacterized protein qtc isoform X2 [Venturia canescens]|uniref:uncharacterized protein qtc isoform X2 n=1 Tax=Venturia canescens TaxID=32260 RepID=UPI001C9CDD89|nr:uncharacterized protein LOC122411305 isoform X2 [Venturia canescens]